MKLIVTSRELRYGGKTLPQGEVFDAHPKHATLFKLLKKADHAPAKPVGHVETTQPPPQPEPTAETEAASEDAPKRSRAYRRRDLTAED